jgi:hypothetical protein
VSGPLARLGRGARRLPRFTAVSALLAVSVTFIAIYATRRDGGTGDLSLGDVVRVGAPQGTSIPAYVQAGRDELAALTGTGEVYALVSFAAYLGPDQLGPVLSGVRVSSAFVRVPMPNAQTEIVRLGVQRLPDDVTAGMDATAERKEREAADYRKLLEKATDRPEDVRQVYASGAKVASAEAEAYRRHCSCVYAAVVHAAPAELRALAERTEVRVVDPAAEVRRLDRTVFLPPLPEQVDRVVPPPDNTR